MQLHTALKFPERYDWTNEILLFLTPSDCLHYGNTSKTTLAFVVNNERLWLFYSLLLLDRRYGDGWDKEFKDFAKCAKEEYASEMMKLLSVPTALIMFRIFRHSQFVLGWYRLLPGITNNNPVLKGGGLVCIQRCNDKIELQIFKANGKLVGKFDIVYAPQKRALVCFQISIDEYYTRYVFYVLELDHPRCVDGGIGLVPTMEGAIAGEHTTEQIFSLLPKETYFFASSKHIRGGRGWSLAHRLLSLKPTREFLKSVRTLGGFGLSHRMGTSSAPMVSSSFSSSSSSSSSSSLLTLLDTLLAHRQPSIPTIPQVTAGLFCSPYGGHGIELVHVRLVTTFPINTLFHLFLPFPSLINDL